MVNLPSSIVKIRFWPAGRSVPAGRRKMVPPAGTDDSNPLPSSRGSAANPVSGHIVYSYRRGVCPRPAVAPEARRLLRVLLLPNRAVPADDLPGQGHFVGTAPRAAVGDLEGRAELWHRHSGRKSDLLYEAMRRETDDDARFALKAE